MTVLESKMFLLLLCRAVKINLFAKCKDERLCEGLFDAICTNPRLIQLEQRQKYLNVEGQACFNGACAKRELGRPQRREQRAESGRSAVLEQQLLVSMQER